MKDNRPLERQRHGSGHFCSHTPPPGNSLISPRRSPHHKPIPVARVSPAIKNVPPKRQIPPPGHQKSHLPSKTSIENGEEIKTWEVEGTPTGFSTSTSLSDLTVDSSDSHRNSKVSGMSMDAPVRYATEGTPAAFSRCDSLSSLSCQDGFGSSPQSRPRSQSPILMRPRSQSPNSKQVDAGCDQMESTRRYMVEGTPAVFSRHSSLSSLEGEGDNTYQAQGKSRMPRSSSSNYRGDCAPSSFSRNSSLSSLSVESYGEVSPSEQALLQQCINQGMPKSKSDLGDKRGMGRRRRGGSRIPAPSSRSPGRMVPGVPMQRLKLLPQSRSNTNLHGSSDSITPTAEAESRKLHSDSEQSEKQERAMSSGACHDVEEMSIGDDITETTEPDSEPSTEPVGDLTIEERIEAVKEISEGTSEITSEGSVATIIPQDSECISLTRCSPHLQTSSPEENESRRSSSEGSADLNARKSSDGSGGRCMEKSSNGSGGRPMDKSTPSWGSIEGRISDNSMSESGILAMEAMKVARAVANEAKQLSSDDASQMSHSVASLSDVLLEQIKAPSMMGSIISLSNSITNSAEENKGKNNIPQRNLECRHTRRGVPEMVRRALGDQDIPADGAASMASSCHSNVDNIMPPSMMMDDDMENSMISVASITSEVAEPRESPPSVGSMNTSMPSEALAEIVGPAQHLANMFLQEAQAHSSLTLTAGDDNSTYQEVTDLEPDNTIGAPDGAASDTELAADDLPPDVPDLPHDSPIRGTRSPHRLTPRSRRRGPMKDRYRTFTKLEGAVDETTYTNNASDSDVSGSPRLTPKQRRQEEADRYRTRTISVSDSPPANIIQVEPEDDLTYTIEADAPNKSPSVSPLKDSPGQQSTRRSFRQRRQDDPLRYQTRTISIPVAEITPQVESPDQDEESDLVEFQDGAELDLTMEQLEALSQDANIVICTLNENREAMTSESSELLSEENILDIETLSLISNEDEDQLADDLRGFDDDDFPEPEEEEQKPVLRRPRILKPGDLSMRQVEDEGEMGKGIRGRRKGLYSSRPSSSIPNRPFRQAAASNPTRSGTTGTASTAIKTAQPGSPKLPRATRASTLRQNSGVMRGGGSSEECGGKTIGSSPNSSNGSSPRLGVVSRNRTGSGRSQSLARPTIEQPKPFQRQNTFTKDDSDTPPSPERTGFSRGAEVRRTVGATPRTFNKSRLRKDAIQPSPHHPTVSRNNLSKTSSQELYNSGSRLVQPKSTSLTRDVRPPSSRDVAEWHQSSPSTSKNCNVKTVKKEVTSRIASLWKKVEKAQGITKTKEPVKDKRMWIQGKKQTPNEPHSTRALVRSSTFERLPNGREAEGPSGQEKNRTRLGLKLSKLRGRDTRSSPPSEATTPVESKPHCLVSPTRITLRHRPNTHPPGLQNTPVNGHPSGEETKAKRLSRLGSFIVVEGSEETVPVRSPQSAIVAPFNYQPPPAKSTQQQRTSSVTRIPQPSKPLLNNPRDDNGNSAYVPGV